MQQHAHSWGGCQDIPGGVHLALPQMPCANAARIEAARVPCTCADRSAAFIWKDPGLSRQMHHHLLAAYVWVLLSPKLVLKHSAQGSSTLQLVWRQRGSLQVAEASCILSL